MAVPPNECKNCGLPSDELELTECDYCGMEQHGAWGHITNQDGENYCWNCIAGFAKMKLIEDIRAIALECTTVLYPEETDIEENWINSDKFNAKLTELEGKE